MPSDSRRQRAQPRQRQRAQLRDARFADADDLADFGQRQLLFVSTAPGCGARAPAAARWPRARCARSSLRSSWATDAFRRVDAAARAATCRPRRARRASARRRRRACAAARASSRSRPATAPSRRRSRFPRARVPRRAAQRGDRAVDIAAQAAQRARRPVEVAQRVEHRALDAAAGEGVERHAERRLVAAGGVDQAEHADADQVGDLDLRRQPLRQPLRQRLDERHVLHHQPVALLDPASRTRSTRIAVPPRRGASGGQAQAVAADPAPRPAIRAARIRKQRLAGASRQLSTMARCISDRLAHRRVVDDESVVAQAAAEEPAGGDVELPERQAGFVGRRARR